MRAPALVIVALIGCAPPAASQPPSAASGPVSPAAAADPAAAKQDERPLDPAAEEAVTAALKQYDDEVAKLEAKFTEPADPTDREWVKRKLAHMVVVDQFMRNYSTSTAQQLEGDARDAFMKRFASRFMSVDRANTADLVALMERYPWFTIQEFGEEASRNAWLLVQHADLKRDLQQDVLARMEPLVATGGVSANNYAYLYDRVQTNFEKPQRYGTQGGCKGEEWEPNTLEDPARVDELRTAVGLPPLAEYRAMFVELCAQSPTPRMRAEQAYRAKDYPTCAELYAAAHAEPRYAAPQLERDIAYNAACCHALAGKPDDAIAFSRRRSTPASPISLIWTRMKTSRCSAATSGGSSCARA